MDTKTMKFLSSVESWNSIFEWSSVALLALTFAAGAGVVITSRIVNKRQASTILRLETSAADARASQQKVEISLAEAKTKQAHAEKALLELQERVRPRALSELEIVELRDKLAGIKCSLPVVILTPQHRFPATAVAELFAKQVADLLKELNWNFSVEEGHGTFPLFGIRIEGFSNEHPIPEVNELAGAFANVTFAATHTQTDPKTPTKLLRIVIGQNPMEGRPQ